MTFPTGGSGRNSDIAFDAVVNDRTIEFFERFDRNLDRIANEAETGFDRVESAANQSGQEIGLIAGVVAGVTNQLVNMGFQALAAVKNFIAGSVQLRARVDVLGTSLEHVASQAGYSAEETARFEEEVKGMGITTAAARQSLLLMTRANIDWAEASKLARVAQDAAVIAGLNSSQAFERLIRGIQKQEPELLDELGITLRRTDAYKKLADQIGKTTKELTEAEKRQAILNEIYEQSGVVAGAYEAAMGNVGKQATSLPRHIEELQLAIGEAFQPVYQQRISFMTEKLKEMREWVDENQEGIQRFGHFLGVATAEMFEMLDGVLKFFSETFPNAIEDAGISLARVIGEAFDVVSPEELEKRRENLGTYFGQAVLLLVLFVSVGARSMLSLIGDTITGLKAMKDAAVAAFSFDQQGIEEAAEQLRGLFDMEQITEDAFNNSRETWQTFTDLFGLTADSGEQAAEDIEEAFEEATDSIEDNSQKAAEALFKVNQAFQNLKEQMEESAEERAIRDMRRQIEDELQASFRREDIERNYQERVQDIFEQYFKDRQQMEESHTARRQQLAVDRAERLINIERDYRQRLQDIQRQFELDAEEYARNRDAVALLRSMRQRDRELEGARINRDRQREETERLFQERIVELEQSIARENQAYMEGLQERLEAAEEQRAKEIENMERAAERRRQIRELHAQWEEEDRQRQYENRLQELAENFAGMDDLTEEGLQSMLEHWENYFGDLNMVTEEYDAIILRMERATQRIQRLMNQSFGSGIEGIRNLNYAIPYYVGPPGGGGDIIGLPGGGVQGQAGQVSQELASAGSSDIMGMMSNALSRIPSVAPAKSSDTRRIIVEVKGNALEPYMQRVVANTILEVERNRGV